MRQKRISRWTAIVLVMLLLTGCANTEDTAVGVTGNLAENAGEMTEENDSSQPTGAVKLEDMQEAVPTPAPTPTPTPEPEFQEYDIKLMMVGDNLMHMGIVNTGKQEDGSYNYDILFDGISDFLDTADIKMINQETILGGNHLGFSGYPTFNSPTEVGDAIVNAGFNVVLHSSNHTADKKIEGLLNCADYWEQYPDMTVAGIHEDTEESAIEIITIEDIDFAILNYTYGPNRAALPEEVEGHMDMLCNYDPVTKQIDYTTLHPDVLTDIAEAEKLADVVIVCPHWGTEYTTTPSGYQQKFAKQMTEAGADVIIGTHPHVVQPMEWIEAENGNKALCYYSLGNYLSTQKQTLCMLEAMAWVTFRVTEDGVTISAEETGVIPMVNHYVANPVRFESVYLLEDYTEEKAASHGIKIYGEVDLYLSDLQKWTEEVFGENVLSAAEVLKSEKTPEAANVSEEAQ